MRVVVPSSTVVYGTISIEKRRGIPQTEKETSVKKNVSPFSMAFNSL